MNDRHDKEKATQKTPNDEEMEKEDEEDKEDEEGASTKETSRRPDDAEKEMKKAHRNAHKKCSEVLRGEKAKRKNDTASYPMPLTVQEAQSASIEAGDKFPSKVAVISKVMSLHEVWRKRFEFLITRPTRIVAKCAHDNHCAFVLDAAYHVDQGNPKGHCSMPKTCCDCTKTGHVTIPKLQNDYTETGHVTIPKPQNDYAEYTN